MPVKFFFLKKKKKKIFHEPTPHEQYTLRALGNIFNFLVSVNASCNFLLYCALSKKYRRTFVCTFCRCFYRRASPIHSMAFFNPSAADDCHSRQASFRHNSRGSSPASISSRGGAHHQQNEYATRRNTIYLSLPEGHLSSFSPSSFDLYLSLLSRLLGFSFDFEP